MAEVVMMVKREGLDKTWQVAPYPVKDEAGALKLVEFLRKAWGIPFVWKLATLS